MNADSSAGIMDLMFTIEEGNKFRAGFIGIVGCGSQDEENEIRALIKLKSGEIFRQNDIEASVTAINGLGRYKIMGESDSIIMPDDKQCLASVVFKVQPKK